jgi:hypothetical protein
MMYSHWAMVTDILGERHSMLIALTLTVVVVAA